MTEIDIKKILSVNIKKFRKVQSLSQFELAEKADISDQTINSIEGCRLWPSDKTLKKIADALDVEVYKFFIPNEVSISNEIETELENAVKNSVVKLIENVLNKI